jgi:hypothetical protein
VKGWTKDGSEVELTPGQEMLVGALLSRESVTLPERPMGSGWSTVLATAARMDGYVGWNISQADLAKSIQSVLLG